MPQDIQSASLMEDVVPKLWGPGNPQLARLFFGFGVGSDPGIDFFVDLAPAKRMRARDAVIGLLSGRPESMTVPLRFWGMREPFRGHSSLAEELTVGGYGGRLTTFATDPFLRGGPIYGVSCNHVLTKGKNDQIEDEVPVTGLAGSSGTFHKRIGSGRLAFAPLRSLPIPKDEAQENTADIAAYQVDTSAQPQSQFAGFADPAELMEGTDLFVETGQTVAAKLHGSTLYCAFGSGIIHSRIKRIAKVYFSNYFSLEVPAENGPEAGDSGAPVWIASPGSSGHLAGIYCGIGKVYKLDVTTDRLKPKRPARTIAVCTKAKPAFEALGLTLL